MAPPTQDDVRTGIQNSEGYLVWRLRLGTWLRKRRKELGLTQYDVSTFIGLHNNSYSALERGELRAFPSPVMIAKLAEKLLVTPDAIMREMGYLPTEEDERTPAMVFTAMRHDVEQLDVPDNLKRVVQDALDYARRRWEDEQRD